MPFASINFTNPRTNPWNFHKKISRIGDFEKRRFFESAIFFRILFFSFLPWKQVKNYWLARMGQNFEQAKRDNTFWPRPNILKNVVFLSKPFFSENFFLTWKSRLPWRMAKILKTSWLTSLILSLQPRRSSSNWDQHRLSALTSLFHKNKSIIGLVLK